MKVSLNWIKEFTDIQIPVDQLAEKVGAQLGAVDEVIDLGKKYKDALIVKVVRCDKHNDADKLSVCLIDDDGKVQNVERNEDGLVQVVCGAPNVTVGMLAVWLPPGSIVPATANKDPFKLESREIRGVVSNGMLASPKELGLSDAHDGLLVVDREANSGDSFAQIYKLDDYIIDIENKMFTHRPDLFGMLGVAREVAGISGQKFSSPKWYLEPNPAVLIKVNSELDDLKIDNQVTELVPRFMAIGLSNVSVNPSPLWLQAYLTKLGIRPINNVVDITNYIMLLSAQPMHAYDYDKVKASTAGQATLVIRHGHTGEKLTLLGGKEVLLDDQAVVIATPDKVIGLGGVMGGAETQVDDHTKNIILECATFGMNITRKTAMKYGLFTDAVTRFSKGQSPLQNLAAITAGINFIKELSGAKVSSELIDNKGKDLSPLRPVRARVSFINSRLGLEIDAEQMCNLLENVEFDVALDQDNLIISPPFWRTDIEIPEDIVEEIGRLYGYDHLPNNLPTRSVAAIEIDSGLKFKSRIRRVLASAGANEVLTYSFTQGELLEKANQDKQQSFHIKNALSPALQHYRQSIIPSLLQKVHPNVKNGFTEFAIFELGKGHIKKNYESGSLPNEMNILGLVYADSGKDSSNKGAAYYQARKYLDYLCKDKLAANLQYVPIESELDFSIAKPYDPSRSALIKNKKGEMLGIIGEFRSSVMASLKLPLRTAGFEIDLDALAKSQSTPQYRPLNKYPEVWQDITLRVSDEFNYVEMERFLLEQLDGTIAEKDYIYSLKPLGIFQGTQDKEHRNISWRITLSHPAKTLTSEEVNEVFGMLEDGAREKFKAERL